MLTVLKVGCLLIYAMALAGLVGLLPAGLASTMQTVALALLVIHALETLVMLRHVRLYPGPLAISVILTLLFGVLHWKPLADAKTKAAAKAKSGTT